MNVARLRKRARHASRVIITTKSRSDTGFIVTGPDGGRHEAPTKAEALANLSARILCHDPAPWKVAPIKLQRKQLTTAQFFGLKPN